jgi:hypothetical protein
MDIFGKHGDLLMSSLDVYVLLRPSLNTTKYLEAGRAWGSSTAAMPFLILRLKLARHGGYVFKRIINDVPRFDSDQYTQGPTTY